MYYCDRRDCIFLKYRVGNWAHNYYCDKQHCAYLETSKSKKEKETKAIEAIEKGFPYRFYSPNNILGAVYGRRMYPKEALWALETRAREYRRKVNSLTYCSEELMEKIREVDQVIEELKAAFQNTLQSPPKEQKRAVELESLQREPAPEEPTTETQAPEADGENKETEALKDAESRTQEARPTLPENPRLEALCNGEKPTLRKWLYGQYKCKSLPNFINAYAERYGTNPTKNEIKDYIVKENGNAYTENTITTDLNSYGVSPNRKKAKKRNRQGTHKH